MSDHKLVVAWHFVAGDRRLRDGRIVRKGTLYRLPEDVEPVMCRVGYHACRRPLDALDYAPGPIACRVELGGRVIEHSDKLVASERRVVWAADATRTLHDFALWCADRALRRERKAGREPDPRSWRALRVKRAWLAGRASDEELREAALAAYAAAYDAAEAAEAAAPASALLAAGVVDPDAAPESAAWAAAQAAAHAAEAAADTAAYAAAEAARDAAEAAAEAVAGAAAADAARAAARAAQDRKLTRLLLALGEGG